ncbi:MAG: hypothetical protein ACLRFM_00890 [Alphaproteobacteria bacterium]
MQKTFKEYIAPVMRNMDENTKNHLMFRFYSIYKLDPQHMFRMVSRRIKTDRIRNFYYCISQLYNQKIDGVRIIANAGQGEIFEKLKSQSGQLPLPGVNTMRDILTGLAEKSTISTYFVSPQIPKQTFAAWAKQLNRRQH